MSAVVYPSTLPAPSSWGGQPFDRAARSPLPGNTQLRGRSRDALQDIDAAWVYSAAEMATWRAWFEDTLLDGMRWFAMSAPGAGGWIDRVLKFRTSSLRRDALGNGHWRVSAKLQQRGISAAPRSLFVDCELLLHFDDASPAAWRDYSVRQRSLSIIEAGTSTVSFDAAGQFGGAMRLSQQNPGSRDVSAYNTQAYIEAAGDIDFGSDEFFVSAFINLDAGVPGTSQDYSIFSSYAPDGAMGIEGWTFQVGKGGDGVLRIGFTMYGSPFIAGSIGVKSSVLSQPTGLVQVAASRKKLFAPGSDAIYLFIGGVHAGTSAGFPTDSSYGGSALGATRIGATDRSATAGTLELVSGYQGLLDELYIVKGPGTGVSSGFVPPTAAYA